MPPNVEKPYKKAPLTEGGMSGFLAGATTRRVLRSITSSGVRRYVQARHREFIFRRAMRKYLEQPEASLGNRQLIRELVYGWGNEGWSAHVDYIEACCTAAASDDRPVLECGSGLTTLLIGAIVQRSGRALWSLEHAPEWGRRTQHYLGKCGLSAVRLSVAPLRQYDGFSWYDPPLDLMPRDFGLVICDGPPADMPGARYGLVPIMKDRLAAPCTILLDDAEREDERTIAARWMTEIGAVTDIVDCAKPYIRMCVTDTGAMRKI